MSLDEIKTALTGRTLVVRSEEYETFCIEWIYQLLENVLVINGLDSQGRVHHFSLGFEEAERLIADGYYYYAFLDEPNKQHKVWIKE
ncbi:MAG: hypothetical protein LUC16_02120 [Coprobacillus sp.]|nr:hypothetical protein [Coprobacillus sp.]